MNSPLSRRILIAVIASAALIWLGGCGISQSGEQNSQQTLTHQFDPMEGNSAALAVRQPHHLDVAALTAHQVLRRKRNR